MNDQMHQGVMLNEGIVPEGNEQLGGLLEALVNQSANPMPAAMQYAQMPGNWWEGGLAFNAPNPLTHLMAPNQVAQLRYASPGNMPQLPQQTMEMLGRYFNNLGMGGSDVYGALQPFVQPGAPLADRKTQEPVR